MHYNIIEIVWITLILSDHLLSQNPKSTLGKQTTLNKMDLLCSVDESKITKENPYTVEMSLKSSTVNKTSVTDPESETKVDLGVLQISDGSDARKQVMSLKSVEEIKPKEAQNTPGDKENDDKIWRLTNILTVEGWTKL